MATCVHFFIEAPAAPAASGGAWRVTREDEPTLVSEFATFAEALKRALRGHGSSGGSVQVHVRRDRESPWRTIYCPEWIVARYPEPVGAG